ncbi:hypothetical protein [Micromonospora okii]|uniref:hypothetical protein n=1 Tax=Micromonospora okii TaxID=1182970 RepID=UPI001E53A924|nr:hypothetical protein [Micromonospora okii]
MRGAAGAVREPGPGPASVIGARAGRRPPRRFPPVQLNGRSADPRSRIGRPRCRARHVRLAEPRRAADALAAVGAYGLPAAKARVALMVALGAGDLDGVRAWFDQW